MRYVEKVVPSFKESKHLVELTGHELEFIHSRLEELQFRDIAEAVENVGRVKVDVVESSLVECQNGENYMFERKVANREGSMINVTEIESIVSKLSKVLEEAQH